MIKDFSDKRKKDITEDIPQGEFRNTCFGDIAIFWSKGKVRKANEDDWGYEKTSCGYLFTVCDGMGGHVGGQIASDIAVNTILDSFSQNEGGKIEDIFSGAIAVANFNIFSDSHSKRPELKGMGTTACVLLVPEQGDTVYFAHVGDSRIYLFRHSDKTLHRITKDHSLVQSLVDKWEEEKAKGVSEQELRQQGLIPDMEMETDNRKNIIMRALGIKEETQPTINSATPANGDIFLICSDGLSGMMTDSDIETILAKNSSLQQTGKELMELALANEGKDNITLQLIQISNSTNRSKSIFPDYNPKSPSKVQLNPQQILTDNIKNTAEKSIPQKQKKNKKKMLLYVIATVVAIPVLFNAFCAIMYYTANNQLDSEFIQSAQPNNKAAQDAKAKYEKQKTYYGKFLFWIKKIDK
ncbi:hypothetical protein FACS1894182_01000 [Bacteroidia bacterium]|nr:hypothetical protein FACS1894182_01000 [Bacteroidia bacterium]